MLHANTRTEYVGFEDERMREKMGARETAFARKDVGRAENEAEVRFSDLVNKTMELGIASARYTWNLMMWPVRSAMSMMNTPGTNGRKI